MRRAVAAARSRDLASRPAVRAAARSNPVVTSRPSTGDARRRSRSRTTLRSVRISHGPPTKTSSAAAACTGTSAGRRSSAVVVQPATAPSAASTPRPTPAPTRPRSARRRASPIVFGSAGRPTSAAAARAARSRQVRALGRTGAAGRVTVSVDASRRSAGVRQWRRPPADYRASPRERRSDVEDDRWTARIWPVRVGEAQSSGSPATRSPRIQRWTGRRRGSRRLCSRPTTWRGRYAGGRGGGGRRRLHGRWGRGVGMAKRRCDRLAPAPSHGDRLRL